MIRYRIRFSDRATHHVDVDVEFEASSRDGTVDLWLPTWTPGSYLIREFARNLRRVSATGAEGRALAITRRDKSSFRIGARPGERVRIHYRVFANELSVRTSYVDSTMAVLNGASIFLAVTGREDEECTVDYGELPTSWNCYTGLACDSNSGSRFVARTYAELIDCPLMFGDLLQREFVAGGKPHRFVLAGAGNHSLDTITEESRRIVETAARTFGPLPYSEYTFLLFTTRDVQSGLEHCNSTLLAFPRFSFKDDKLKVDLATLIAHEHFHSWNVKRTKPREFVPYDLKSETYTKSLWICEGVTSYYDELLVLRAGIITRDQYLIRLGEEISRYLESPGRLEQSLEESSLTTWTRFYRQDEDYPNSGISYYQKGCLVALLLDLEIRYATDSKRTLDDVMRSLFERHAADSPGFSAEEFESLASQAAGKDLSEFFEVAVRGTQELDFAAALERFAVKWTCEDRAPSPTARDWIGVRIKPGANPLRIDVVERNSPAECGGLGPGDEIVALDGQRVTAATLAERLREARGCSVRIDYFRDDSLATCTVLVPKEPSKIVKLAWRDGAGADAVARLEKWLESPASRFQSEVFA